MSSDDGRDELMRQIKALNDILAEPGRLAAEARAERQRLKEEIEGLPQPHVMIHNETVKYTATLLNTLAAGSIVAGAVGPVTVAMNTTGLSVTLATVATAWLGAGAALHWLARKLLRQLR